MKKTKFAGVEYNELVSGDRTYYIRYKDRHGKLIREKVGRKSEGITPQFCKRLRDQRIVTSRLGEDAPVKRKKGSRLFDEVAREYFEQADIKSLNTVQSYYENHIKDRLGNTPIASITPDTLESLRKVKQKEVSPKTKRQLSDRTVNYILAVVSQIMGYAESKGYIQSVPKVKKLKLDNRRERFLTTDEIKMLIKTIEESNLPTKKRLLLFVKLSLSTGGRLGSILSIQGKDIDRANNTIKLKNHKTGKTYTAFVPQSLMDEIPDIEPQQKLFDIKSPRRMQQTLQNILDILFNEGLNPDDRKDRVVLHTFRHTFASHLAIKGTPIYTIQRLMNHEDISMTLRYAKLAPDSGREAVEHLYE